ncbi:MULTISPECIES: phosphoenolpyruvate synthase [Hydrocarboniphaga]|uniref:Phosphoenolpyruvate synthase n=1 Tax=Hydrocarboniphaga effusa AP103 TaxID=1172194 RepID=I7Z9K7_9GAMM|nr:MULTISPECIES: phosphoenolpyruvate synthase [Hydrocarboniphaga]EIT68362.1 phosphoenolpyruvate synthase [Hydrocarboniphaga effusa AP103]MDZ4078655.1 phosphoenolpyruvate synthase [Hydrocarboniphaga sp.]
MSQSLPEVVPLESVGREDVPLVGGKNASLGEMIRKLADQGVRVPGGFALTAHAYRRFVETNRLAPEISEALSALSSGALTLAQAGERIRTAFSRSIWSDDLAATIRSAYQRLCQQHNGTRVAVAVRSSATAEDLPDASFAGQQETYLNVVGETALLNACRNCFASLYTDRAISYRQARGFDHQSVALSVGVQLMVRADSGGSGVMFSVDTETGCDRVVIINASWGLGETIVQGRVDPDEYVIFKPLLTEPALVPIIERKIGGKALKMIYSAETGATTRTVTTSVAERESSVLSDSEILQLARWACIIEKHYGVAMDMEWAKDGDTAQLYIVQARPETAQSQRKQGFALETHRVVLPGRLLLSGLAVGEAAAAGRVRLVTDPRAVEDFPSGSILVAENTDPDWVPLMRKAAAIVTDHGGRTSHAAIVSRELGVPALIGTGEATRLLHDGQDVTVSCAEGDIGHIYEGQSKIQIDHLALDEIPITRTKVMLNIANPASALRSWRLPADGIGLARMEFVISNTIKVHPMALVHLDRVTDKEQRRQIEQLTRGYADRTEYFVERLSAALGRIAASCYPKPMILRFSDFKTNEYADLLGGRDFEPHEENPMIGLRGASRYYSPRYRDGFALECRAIKQLREKLGFSNVIVMVPFCRTPEEADQVLTVMALNGLQRGQGGLKVYVMCEIPSNVILAEEFAKRFDGFSIGSNDLTQLTLGVDRDSDELAPLFSERSPAVISLIKDVIRRAHELKIPVGLCGEAPSSQPDFAGLLVRAGIDSISVSPSSFAAVKRNVRNAEHHFDNFVGVR